MSDKTEMYSGIGCGIVILAFLIGLGALGLMSSIAGKYDAEAKMIERSAKP